MSEKSKAAAEMREARERDEKKNAAREKAARERLEAGEKASARHAWIADGGSAEAFEKNWTRLRDEKRVSKMLSADDEARERHRRMMRRSF